MSSNVGTPLRRKREIRGLSIEQAANATRIRPHYLRAIEADEFELFPSSAHARGFLRAYADFLEIDPEPLVQELDRQAFSSGSPDTAESHPTPITPPSEDQLSFNNADEIFQEIGLTLRHQREQLGISIEDVERHTHLRVHYLKALEDGSLEALPSPVQGRGMLNNYASFLGLNPDTLLLRFADGLQAQLEAKRLASPPPKSTSSRIQSPQVRKIRQLFSPDILIGGSIALFLGVFILWGMIRIFTMNSGNEPTMTALSIAEVLLATPTPTETPTPSPATEPPPAQQPVFPTVPLITGEALSETQPAGGADSNLQIYLTIQQRSWMRVTVDGDVQFEGRVIPGSAYPFSGRTQVEVLTGNAAGVQVFYNGVDLGVMGARGEVADRIFTIQGVITPTPTLTATPSPATPGTPGPETQSTTPVLNPTIPSLP